MRSLLVLTLAAFFLFSGHAFAQIDLLATGKLPEGDDHSGLTNKLEGGFPANRLGSHGSGIAYTGKAGRYVLAPDRGPKDGAVSFPARYHEADIHVDVKAKTIACKLIATHLLKSKLGQSLIGLSSAFGGKETLRFDPEGICVGPKGEIFISEEYGPSVVEFSPTGQWVRAFPIPERFTVAKPNADEKQEGKLNAKGRVTNRGLEGLTISPDGKTLFAMLQSPLIQDGGRKGVNVRMLALDRGGAPAREYVYQVADADLGINEILAVDAHTFLVLERDGKDKKRRSIYLARLTDATTDVSKVDKLPRGSELKDIVPLTKRSLIDFMDPRFELAGKMPEKIEGLAFGPDLADGRKLILVTTDNDFRDEPSMIYAFAIPKAELGK